MNIRWKTLLIVSMTASGLISILSISAQKTMLDGIAISEKKYAESDAQRFLKSLSFELSGLNSTVNDWAT
jgi:sensor domain CHASE-containing protein